MENMTPEEILEAAERLVITGPQILSMRQARLQMLEMDILDDVISTVATMPTAVQIEWEFSTVVDRNSPAFGALLSLMNFDEDQVNEFFRDGAKL
jgi:hypothetical protein